MYALVIIICEIRGGPIFNLVLNDCIIDLPMENKFQDAWRMKQNNPIKSTAISLTHAQK